MTAQTKQPFREQIDSELPQTFCNNYVFLTQSVNT